MKKLFLLSLTLFLVSTAMSQEFTLGPRIGISQTKIDLKNDMFTPGDAEVGYHVGVFARISAASFYVQPEVLYTQTSGTFVVNGPTPGGNGNFDLEFNRLDVPVMVGIKVLKVLRIQAGPILSIDLDSKLKDPLGTPIDVDYKKSSVAYQAGLGVDIGNFVLDAKYEGSLGGVVESIGGLETDERLSQFVFSLGFKLF